MQKIDIFQIDTFTDKVFHGNPAAICLLHEWLNDELLKAIAMENNLSETAFLMEGPQGFQIRWFTPKGEINLCGHATFAAGFLLFELGKGHADSIQLSSVSGSYTIRKKGSRLTMGFPRFGVQTCHSPELIGSIIDKPLLGVYESDLDYLVLLEHEQQVLSAQIDLKLLAKYPRRGLIVTSIATGEADFYSRCFYPRHNIPEDPVTGSAHCVLAPFWAERLNKKVLHGRQGSFRRGDVFCEVFDDHVYLSGYCRWYSKGQLVF